MSEYIYRIRDGLARFGTTQEIRASSQIYNEYPAFTIALNYIAEYDESTCITAMDTVTGKERLLYCVHDPLYLLNTGYFMLYMNSWIKHVRMQHIRKMIEHSYSIKNVPQGGSWYHVETYLNDPGKQGGWCYVLYYSGFPISVNVRNSQKTAHRDGRRARAKLTKLRQDNRPEFNAIYARAKANAIQQWENTYGCLTL